MREHDVLYGTLSAIGFPHKFVVKLYFLVTSATPLAISRYLSNVNGKILRSEYLILDGLFDRRHLVCTWILLSFQD